jgi:hypothetical protein
MENTFPVATCIEHKCVHVVVTLFCYVCQELCMLLDDYWERMNLKVPIYLSAGMCVFVLLFTFYVFSCFI